MEGSSLSACRVALNVYWLQIRDLLLEAIYLQNNTCPLWWKVELSPPPFSAAVEGCLQAHPMSGRQWCFCHRMAELQAQPPAPNGPQHMGDPHSAELHLAYETTSHEHSSTVNPCYKTSGEWAWASLKLWEHSRGGVGNVCGIFSIGLVWLSVSAAALAVGDASPCCSPLTKSSTSFGRAGNTRPTTPVIGSGNLTWCTYSSQRLQWGGRSVFM